jgi:hypothetical protein
MKKINEGSGTLNSAEFKAILDRLKRKEPELDELAIILEGMTDQGERTIERLDKSEQEKVRESKVSGEHV